MTNKFRLMLLSMATLGIFGCADKLTDDVVQSPGDIGGETGYLSFRIKSADTGGMTRATGDAWLDDDSEDKDYHKGEGADDEGEYADEYAVVNNIQANRVFFFDADGGYHSSSLLNLTQIDDSQHDGSGHASTYPETYYSATVKRTSDRGANNWPTQCLVILNGRPARLNALLAQAQADPNFGLIDFLGWINKDFRDDDVDGEGLTLGLYKYSGDKKYYFTMTNSVFIDDDIVNATQIPSDNLKPTSEEAAANPITVYVERIMAKVEVGFSGYDDAGEDMSYFPGGNNKYGFIYTFGNEHETDSKWLGYETEEETPIKLKALITNWTINAVEYQTKLFKEIDNTWTDQTLFEGWNDVNHHRSYWAKDINYLWNGGEGEGTPAKGYPTQYRSIFPNDNNTTVYEDGRSNFNASDWGYGEETEEKNFGANDILNPNYPWALDYKSFNAIKTPRKHKYCFENTFESDDELTYQNMIMGSHLLIQARLLTEDEANGLEENGLDGISDKYYYSDRYYNKETYIKRQIAIINEVLSTNVTAYKVNNRNMWDDGEDDEFDFDNVAGGLWIKEGEKYKQVVAKVTDEENQVDAAEVFDVAPAYVPKGDGKVTIALKGNDANGYGYGQKGVNLYYLAAKGVTEEGQPATEPVQFTRNMLVSLIYQVTNVADCFHQGMMYYAVPVQHYKAAGAGNDYGIDYTSVKTGDYGIVRNHWYKFNINTIMTPGIPVHDPDQPIIPNYDEEDRYIGFEVVILPWHIVDNGNVTLGK